MGVTHQTIATYVCDQTGEQVVIDSDDPAGMGGPPEGWINIGGLWFSSWAALADYAAGQGVESGGTT